MQSPLPHYDSLNGSPLKIIMAVMALAALTALPLTGLLLADTGVSPEPFTRDLPQPAAPATDRPASPYPLLAQAGPAPQPAAPAEAQPGGEPRTPGQTGTPRPEAVQVQSPSAPSGPDIPHPTQRSAAPGTCPERTLATGNQLEAEFLHAGWDGDQYNLVLKLDNGETRAFVPLGMTSEFAAPEGTRIRVIWGIREFTQAMTEACTTAPVIEMIGRIERTPRR